jgi:hypothetical protein
MDTQKLKGLMKTYLEKDNEYREYMKSAEPLKMKRDDAKDAVMQFFQESGFDENINMNTEDGVVQYRKSKSYGGVTKKLLAESLDTYIKDKGMNVDVKDIINYVWGKREPVEKWELNRKMDEE